MTEICVPVVFKENECFNVGDFSIDNYFNDMQAKGILLANFKERINLLELVKKIGIPHAHNTDDKYVWDIQPKRKKSELVRSLTAESFPLHTDCCFEEPVPTYFGLYVLQTDREGGGYTTLVDTRNIFPLCDKATIENLKKIYRFSVPREFFKGKNHLEAPIILENGGIRYRRECIMEEFCSSEQFVSLNRFDELINRPEFATSFLIPSGSVLFVDNTRYLHGRTEIKDPERHLQRIRYF